MKRSQRRASARRMRRIRIGMVACSIVLFAAAGILLGNRLLRRETPAEVNTAQAESVEPPIEPQKDTLILYFDFSENIGDTTGWDLDAITSASMAGEHVIERGNLLVMEQMLEERLDADVYAIHITEPYGQSFEAMADNARNDIDSGKTFSFVEPIPDLSGYETIYLGTPVWWYGLPRPVSSFLEQVDLSGKQLVYFGIHRGSGDSGNPETIESMFNDLTIVDSFAVDASTDNAETRSRFNAFLEGLNL